MKVWLLKLHHHSFMPHPSSFLLGLFVPRVLTAAAAEFTELKTLRGSLLILRRHVVTTLAVRALKHNVIAWHLKSPFKLKRRLPVNTSATRYERTIQQLRRPFQHRQFFHPHEWRTSVPSPWQWAQSTRSPSPHYLPASPSPRLQAVAPHQSRPSF